MFRNLAAMWIPAPCVECTTPANYANTGDEPVPVTGDLVVCLACDTLQVYTPGRGVRLFDLDDLDDYNPEDLAIFLTVVEELRLAFARRN